ncbi:hypothetical protein D3C80_825460 [compost metagenome]
MLRQFLSSSLLLFCHAFFQLTAGGCRICIAIRGCQQIPCIGMQSVTRRPPALFTHGTHTILGLTVVGICRQSVLFQCQAVVRLAAESQPQHLAIGIAGIHIAFTRRKGKALASRLQLSPLLLQDCQLKLSLTHTASSSQGQPMFTGNFIGLLQAQLVFSLMEALACGQLQPVPAQRQILGHLFTRQIGLPQPQLS